MQGPELIERVASGTSEMMKRDPGGPVGTTAGLSGAKTLHRFIIL